MANDAAQQAPLKQIWVAPEGNDASLGAEPATPICTLGRALDLVRANASRAAEIRVLLAGGNYRLTEPLVFENDVFSKDGPKVTFAAQQGAFPVISGAMKVDGPWTLHDPTFNIYRTAVGSVKSRHFYVNGRRATRARTQAYPGGFQPSPDAPVWCNPTCDAPPPVTPFGGGIYYNPLSTNPSRWNDPAKWTNIDGIEAVLETQWKMMRLPLQAVVPHNDAVPGIIKPVQPAWTNANLYYSMNGKGETATAKPGVWSFWRVSWFENAYQFLDEPGEWYLDEPAGFLYYIPTVDDDMASASCELAICEELIVGAGTPDRPVANLCFERLTFAYATWLGTNSGDGYVADQSGFRVVGTGHKPNIIGHVRDVVRTPGNVSFEYACDIVFDRNRFAHMGAVALDFAAGCQNIAIRANEFLDISAAAIQMGGVSDTDARPPRSGYATKTNIISGNLIDRTGREYTDSAAIYVGFVAETEISNNTIQNIPWSGIAMGWGWGLLDWIGDEQGYPGLPEAKWQHWGTFTEPTINNANRILRNDISRFVQDRWDGGAIYTTGAMGQSIDGGLLVVGNVAHDKRPDGGSNIFYFDGGSNYINFSGNASYNNPIGKIDLGPPIVPFNPAPPCSWLGLRELGIDIDQDGINDLIKFANGLSYGGEIGGCRTYGNITAGYNYWMQNSLPAKEFLADATAVLIDIVSALLCFCPSVSAPYSSEGFFNICPYTDKKTCIRYPTNMFYSGNVTIPNGRPDIPPALLAAAGVQGPVGP